MTENIAIKVESLGKCYHIYEQPSHRLLQMLWRGHKQFYREFWALKDVSFELMRGETVGIIGRNGSGKSTLLQMLCGTLNPTSGYIETKGRIAALLELGSGFNPEFTGRENIYLNASILGLSHEETALRYGAIVDYSEIGEFIDQPVKTYSTGMIMRLAFAVAIQVDPDILIVDEALSVGDERFQRKCFSRIDTLRSRGATILFVSHSGGTILELCDRALLLDSGERIAMGSPKKIVGRYQKLLYAPKEKRDDIRAQICREDVGLDEGFENGELPNDKVVERRDINTEIHDSFNSDFMPASTIVYESYGAVIKMPEIYNIEGVKVNNVTRGNRYVYRYHVSFNRPSMNVRFGMLIKTKTGVELGGAVSAVSNKSSLQVVEKGESYFIEFEFVCRLNPGYYFMNAGVVGEVDGSETYLHRIVDAVVFRVISEAESQGTGTVDFSCSTTLKKAI